MIIYKTTNLINGKFYIGQDFKNDPYYFGSGKLLKRAIEKYGIENFTKEILEECISQNHLNEQEKYWIKKTNAKILGYNIADGGQGGNTYTEETKKRISEQFKGRQVSPETVEKRKKTRAKNPEKYKLSDDRKKIIGDQHRGKTISEEQKQKSREYNKSNLKYSDLFLEKQKSENKIGEKNPMWGRNHSESTRKKMAEAHKKNPVRYWLGKKQSLESNEKRRQYSLTRRHTEEYKELIRGEGNPFYGKRHSEATKNKMKAARKNKTPQQKLERYVKFYISKTGKEPSDKQKKIKFEEYSKC
jgi:group I intron endonuclease